MAEVQKGERIAKVIARAGLCSRRDAEAWIAAGRVSLDGKVLTSAAAVVTLDSRIEVDGEPLPASGPPRLFRYHKPRGEITTTRDPQGRTTVFDHLPPGLPRLQAVGRLDINSEGLLLLTNDGGLKRTLELPTSGWLRRYRVRAHGPARAERLAALAKGVTVDGVDYGPIEATLDRQDGTNAWLTIGLREGKNREVRKICAHLGLYVNRLIRIAYGPFSLGKLPKRGIEEVERTRLRQALGLEEKDKKKQGKGFAKAKAKPNRPGSKRGFKHVRDAKDALESGNKAEARAKRGRVGRGKPDARKPESKMAPGPKPAAKPPAKKTAAKNSAAKKAGSGKPAAPKSTAKMGPAPKRGESTRAGKKRVIGKPATKKPGAKKPAARPSGAKSSVKAGVRKSSGPRKHANRRRPS
jgi:23S rRNA pseudouridine2605 synthase